VLGLGPEVSAGLVELQLNGQTTTPEKEEAVILDPGLRSPHGQKDRLVRRVILGFETPLIVGMKTRVKCFRTNPAGTWSGLIRRSRRRSLPGQFSGLEHNHVFIEGLKHGVVKTPAAVEKAALGDIERQEFEQRSSWRPIEQLLLMKAALVKILSEDGLAKAERLGGGSILHDLARFERAVRIMPVKPMHHTLAERIVVEVAGKFSHRSIGNRNRIDEPFIAHLVGAK
jgi:hypothetical protein